MQLIQRNDPGHAAQVLPVTDNSVDTGYMGDCACVIVLHSPGPNGSYTSVRGYHGGGGLGNVNFTSVLMGAPDLASTLVIGISGTQHGSLYAQQTNRTHLRNEANLVAPNATVRMYHGRARATVDRNGDVRTIA